MTIDAQFPRAENGVEGEWWIAPETPPTMSFEAWNSLALRSLQATREAFSTAVAWENVSLDILGPEPQREVEVRLVGDLAEALARPDATQLISGGFLSGRVILGEQNGPLEMTYAYISDVTDEGIRPFDAVVHLTTQLHVWMTDPEIAIVVYFLSTRFATGSLCSVPPSTNGTPVTSTSEWNSTASRCSNSDAAHRASR